MIEPGVKPLPNDWNNHSEGLGRGPSAHPTPIPLNDYEVIIQGDGKPNWTPPSRAEREAMQTKWFECETPKLRLHVTLNNGKLTIMERFCGDLSSFSMTDVPLELLDQIVSWAKSQLDTSE